MYRGTRKLVPLFYYTILQNAKEREQSQACLNYAERRSISMMEHQNAKKRAQSKVYLNYAERRSILIIKIKTQKCKNAKRIVSY